MNELDLAWLAGLLEGEGSFYLKAIKSRQVHVPTIALKMTDLDVVERARTLMGIKRVTRLKPGADTWKPQYDIRITGRRAVVLMRQLAPHMGVRRASKIADILAMV